MGDETYDGWTNYPTWAVNLWLSSDEVSYNGTLELARESWEVADDHPEYLTREEAARIQLADVLAHECEEADPLADEASVFSDLIGWAIGNVDWYEIAEHWIADVLAETKGES
jgi:hypothetical protein